MACFRGRVRFGALLMSRHYETKQSPNGTSQLRPPFRQRPSPTPGSKIRDPPLRCLGLFLQDSLVQADESSNCRARHHACVAARHAFIDGGDGVVLEESEEIEVFGED